MSIRDTPDRICIWRLAKLRGQARSRITVEAVI
jgi:hypothetical protein